MPALTQTVISRIYDCSREYPDCIDWAEHVVDIDDASAMQALARRIASDCEGDEESEDWDILVCIETEDGTELARATTTNDHAEHRQDSMDETFEDQGEYSTDCVGVRDGQWFAWSRNGGSRGAHDRMTNRGWRESYEEPRTLDEAEAYLALTTTGCLGSGEAIEKIAEHHDSLDADGVRQEIIDLQYRHRKSSEISEAIDALIADSADEE